METSMLPELSDCSRVMDDELIHYWSVCHEEDILNDARILIESGYPISAYWADHGSFHEPLIYFYIVVGDLVDQETTFRFGRRAHNYTAEKKIAYPKMGIAEVKKKIDEANKRISDLYQMSRKHWD